jgi:catechol 2,3-dioxygenase
MTLSTTPIADRIASCREPGAGAPFDITKIGHVVLKCGDIERSVAFYTQVLGFRISDVYEEDMLAGGMVFMRFNADHHGIALIGAGSSKSDRIELHHIAFAVSSLDEVFRARDHLVKNGVAIIFEGRRRAGVQIAVEFADPDGHMLEIYWGLDQIGSDGRVRPGSEWRGATSLEDAVAHPVRGQRAIVHDERLIRKTSE